MGSQDRALTFPGSNASSHALDRMEPSGLPLSPKRIARTTHTQCPHTIEGIWPSDRVVIRLAFVEVEVIHNLPIFPCHPPCCSIHPQLETDCLLHAT